MEKNYGIKIWAAHWAAFQMTSINLNRWKFKYLFHDTSKLLLLMWYKTISPFLKHKNIYELLQARHHLKSNHHLQSYNETMVTMIDENLNWKQNTYIYNIDIEAMLINWECAHLTKTNMKPSAYDYYMSIKEKLTKNLQNEIETKLKEMNMWK